MTRIASAAPEVNCVLQAGTSIGAQRTTTKKMAHRRNLHCGRPGRAVEVKGTSRKNLSHHLDGRMKMRMRMRTASVVRCFGTACAFPTRSSQDTSLRTRSERQNRYHLWSQDQRRSVTTPSRRVPYPYSNRKSSAHDPVAVVASSSLLTSSVAFLESSASTLQTALALGLVVTVHECGHFAAARLQNIHVSKFSVGFGPCVLRYKGKKVEYSLRLFPFGGFVAFPEEKSGDADTVRDFPEDDPNLLNNRPVKDRFLVISAGVVANMIMAFSILWSQALNPGLMQVTYYPGVKVPELSTTSVALQSGIKVGDTITGINGYDVGKGEEAVDKIVDAIKRNPGRDVTINLKRSEQALDVKVTPEDVGDGTGRVGIQLVANAEKQMVRANGILDGAGMASKETVKLTKAVLGGFQNLLFNFQQNVDKLSGPVAIIANGSQYTRNNLYDILQFMVIININLAVINTVPLPGLDGGYLALLFAETLRGGKKLPENVESAINQSGFTLLFLAGITLLIKDSIKLIQ